MSPIMKRPLPVLVFLILTLLCVPFGAYAQTPACTTATCTAASVAENDVINALPSSANTNATVTVTIPAGSATWSSTYYYNVPNAVTNLTIHGQTTCTGSGDPAHNNLACTDSTLIVDGLTYTSADPALIHVNPNTGAFRLTGISIRKVAVSCKPTMALSRSRVRRISFALTIITSSMLILSSYIRRAASGSNRS